VLIGMGAGVLYLAWQVGRSAALARPRAVVPSGR
jgi:hypothetical protein